MKKYILESFFPDGIECVLCDALIFETHNFLCKDCQLKFNYIVGKSCNGCGKSLPNSFDGEYCSECMGHEQLYYRGLSCVAYDEFSAEVIWKFKYHHKRYIGRMIGRSMAELLKATYIEDVNLIVPVPIANEKKKIKGYNHSGIIAREIGEYCGIKVLEDFLIRKKNTRPLKDLTKIERIKELCDVFERNGDYKELTSINRRILLVDDIYTTGTTLKECCRILNKCGFEDVIVMTFATGNL